MNILDPFYMHTYTDNHVNHINDTAKIWPVNIPWDINTWESNQTIRPNVNTISGDVLRELRQHAKALQANFSFAAQMPSFSAVSDQETEEGTKIEESKYNNPGGTGLIDGVNDLGISPGAVSAEEKIDKNILNNIAQGLENKSSYNNYSNVTNTGYNRYVNYSRHSVHAKHNNNFYYRDGWHTNYNYKNKHSNTNAHTNAYGKYQNNTVNHPRPVIYQNSFNNPAIYQNTL